MNVIKKLCVAILLISLTNCGNKMDRSKIKPPDVEKKPKELVAHGDTRIDNYYWLNNRENPEVISYLEAENEYTDKMLAHTEEFQDKLYNEMISRLKQDDESVPYKDNGYFYYSRYEEGKEYPYYCRKKGSLEAGEEIMLNVPEMAKGFDFYQVGGLSVSQDNKIAAYGVDTLSRRKYDIHFRNLETGKDYDEVINNTTGSVAWAADNKTCFYTVKDENTLRACKIYKHVLGTDPADDKLIFSEDDDTFVTTVYKTKSDEYLMIASFSTLSTEFRYLKADNPDGNFKVIEPREREHEYAVYHYGDDFYIKTNLEAKNFKLVKTPVNKTGRENWKEVIPHRSDVLLEDVEIFKKYLVLEERIKGLSNLRIIKWDDKSEHYLNFGEETYTAYISTNMDFDTDLLRYGYTSLTTPNSTYDYNMSTKEKTLLKEQPVLGDFNKEDYEAERLYAKADDGTEVPISLVYKNGARKDGSAPLLLYAYGSYGYSMDPYFSSARLSLLNRGFIFAIAHIRGGQEMGRQWYEDGKLLKKKNTFTDYIDCAEYLLAENYTTKEKLFAMGGSAGGLLMGAVANMSPQLFKGIVAQVPFVDVITTMLDDSIPLTTGEYDEWGNPNEKEFYDYILTYSPYDNVKKQAYPNMLVTTGLHDSQVQYWEPAKWVAKLRDMKTDNNILLLKTNMEAGHGGASGRFKRYKETALEYAFILDQLEIYE